MLSELFLVNYNNIARVIILPQVQFSTLCCKAFISAPQILVSRLASKARDIGTRKIRYQSTLQKGLCFRKRLHKDVSVKIFSWTFVLVWRLTQVDSLWVQYPVTASLWSFDINSLISPRLNDRLVVSQVYWIVCWGSWRNSELVIWSSVRVAGAVLLGSLWITVPIWMKPSLIFSILTGTPYWL